MPFIKLLPLSSKGELLNLCYDLRTEKSQTPFLGPSGSSCVSQQGTQLFLFSPYFLFLFIWLHATSFSRHQQILSALALEHSVQISRAQFQWQHWRYPDGTRPGSSLKDPTYLQAQPTQPSMVSLCQRVSSLLFSTLSPVSPDSGVLAVFWDCWLYDMLIFSLLHFWTKFIILYTS